MTPPAKHLHPVTSEATDLGIHVAVCEQRYAATERRLGTIERTLGKLLWTVVGGLGAIILMMAGWILSRIS